MESAILNSLNKTVADAVDFIGSSDESLCDGDQTLREVVSHLVFWHREYLAILKALSQNRQPALRETSLYKLNAMATEEFAEVPIAKLATQLSVLQTDLDTTLRNLSDWRINFPIKRNLKYLSVADRVQRIDAHIQGHVVRLRRAVRRSQGRREIQQ